MNGLSPGKYVPSSPICTEPFNSKYTIQEDIGRGKFAVVRKCVNKDTGEVVAAKVIRKRRKGKSCRDEILREVVMLELAMAHSRLVSLREVFETQSELILVTEYCSGGELFHECVINESFKEDDVRKLLVQILEGLAYLHDNNIVHLDLKPQNILLTKPFPEGQVKICDLGFACLTDTGEDIRDIIGTPDYVAPEVLDYEPLNIQTDMWSLGVLTYVMLTTCSPFAGDTQQETFCNITQAKVDFPKDLFEHISPLAQDFISNLLVKTPRDRMTARQCLDHPWLHHLKDSMSINVPMTNLSEGLAQDMVVPSNWHMTPDRRSSTSSVDTSMSTISVGKAGGEVPSLPSLLDSEEINVEAEEADTGRIRSSISEEKDFISNTLSHIDIDNHSIDKRSTSSYETCPECIASDAGSTPSCMSSSAISSSGSDLSSVLISKDSISSSETSDHTLTPFVTSLIDDVTKECGRKSAISDSKTTGFDVDQRAPDVSLAHSQMSEVSESERSCLKSDVQSTKVCLSSSASVSSSTWDSNKLDHSKKRISMEIPPKKAKCIQDEVEGNCPEPVSGLTSPNFSLGEHSRSDQPDQNCNGLDDCRNAV